MRFFLFFLLLLSCGKKTIYKTPPMPANEASPETQEMIHAELLRLQKDFSELNVNVNLTRLPVVVSNLPFGVVGRCQYKQKSDGAYIILSPSLFWENTDLPTPDAFLFEKEFVRVLIHEIGHCYFHRKHEEPKWIEAPGHSIELIAEGGTITYDRIPRSLMPAESNFRLPKNLRKYYLEELVHRVRRSDPVILERYTEYQVVAPAKSED